MPKALDLQETTRKRLPATPQTRAGPWLRHAALPCLGGGGGGLRGGKSGGHGSESVDSHAPGLGGPRVL